MREELEVAEHYEIQIPTHNSIYGDCSDIEAYEREMEVYFSVPSRGVGDNTGLLLLIAGFGGHAQANVYKKMREQFADQYDLVVVQCDYFGWEYMQMPSAYYLNTGQVVDVSLLESFRQQGIYSLDTCGKWENEETWENFNDMGIMQAVDNLIAVLSIIYILQNKSIKLNAERMFLYGHSHGSYLSYFCNRIAPGLFTSLIDNSAWLFPAYINTKRILCTKVPLPSLGKEEIKMNIYINYFAANMKKKMDAFSLKKIYSGFKNQCNILSYHGIDDELIGYKEKEKFCHGVTKCSFRMISKKSVDGIVFKSTKHGLDADYLKLFNLAMNEKKVSKMKSGGRDIEFENIVEFETDLYQYTLNYSSGLPFIKRKKK